MSEKLKKVLQWLKAVLDLLLGSVKRRG